MGKDFKRKYKKDEDDEEDEEEEAPRGRARKSTDDEDGIVACDLSSTRKVKVRKFKGMVLIDIREYWKKGDELLPGKKGISLTLDQWKSLKEKADDVDAAIKELE